MIEQEVLDKITSRIMEYNGAFFAFNKQQFEEQRVNGTKYTVLDGGLISPDSKVERLIDELDIACKNNAEKVLDKYGVDYIIEYELDNHEVCITGSLEDTNNAVSIYGISSEQVNKLYSSKKYRNKMDTM